ncbi:tRNA ligase 1 [Lolium perenne]|uniref:tRNA ligase 1 n=1 Tax=Lolium perenne TaxID=4522 RepID=UPI0021F67F39|nr:tRNA ligase 1 [Lolium perenne]
MSLSSSLLSPRRLLPLLLPLRLSSPIPMPPRRDHGKQPDQKWKPKAASSAAPTAGIQKMTLAPGASAQVWVPRAYATSASSPSSSSSSSVPAEHGAAADKLSALFKGAEDFAVDDSTFVDAQIRAAFYPKFENEKSDQETRNRMIEMVSQGLATMEVTLKHSGSLFMYAGHLGGAYAKNSYGNIYTAVGVFVLGRLFREAWGKEAPQMQAEFNDCLEKNRISISMELVTAVLGDHGQRPKDDYAVVTAVTELGHGKPKFYSTPEVIAFCRKWRLPTNHVWLFSTRESATSFFAAYDALCEEGTATPVCNTLDEIADISVPGSKDHVMVQGEILEGLVARVVSRESSVQMEEVLKNFPQPSLDGGRGDSGLGPSLREICAANRSDEKQQIKALLDNVGSSMCPVHCDWFGNGGLEAHSRNADKSVVTHFLQAHPTDYATKKLQEMIRLMKQKNFRAAFKCYWNSQKVGSLSNDNLYYKMVIHVHSDSVFKRYQQEMRKNQGLWPLYRGFFVDVNLFKANNKKAAELSKDSNTLLKNIDGALDPSSSTKDSLADEDSNLMVKLKFLTYKIRTFLIRNGLSTLFKDGPSAYKTYYLRQMKIWGTSASKQKELTKMLDEWAVYIRRKCGNKQLSSSTYLSEAEPFLEQYAKRSPANQALIGAAGDLVQTENFLAILDAQRDEEGDLQRECGAAPSSPASTSLDVVSKTEGLIVFFPGIPGCAKSALCEEILNTPGGLDDSRPVHSLMGDRIKGRYWQKVADERKKKPFRITLADKNAPNEEVWRQIEDMCGTTKAAAVPVIPDSEGTDSNPFSLEALAVFMFRVLQRVNHPGNLDKASPNPGYVLLMFYNLYDGKSRREFESELYERFGSLIKMPLLKPDRAPLPGDVKGILDEGISLFRLHQSRHGRAEPSKGSYAKEWAQWEKRLRVILSGNANYLTSIQVPFEVAVKEVLEQLKAVAKGDIKTPDTAKRKFGNIVFAAVTVPQADILGLLRKLGENDSDVNNFLNGIKVEDNLSKAHVTLAHKRAHGVAAVASYGVYQNQEVPVSFSAFLYTDKMAALEAKLGAVNGENVNSRNEWPHVTLWTAPGVAAKEANALPQLVSSGQAKRVLIDPPITISGVMDFY